MYAIIRNMTSRKVKTVIKQLVRRYGSHKELARILEVSWGYIYQLEHGRKPGKRLYRDINDLYRRKR